MLVYMIAHSMQNIQTIFYSFLHNKKIDQSTVNENQCYTPRLMFFRFVLLDHLPVEKVPQMIYHLKALI